jgi:hypothetical protein
MSRSATSILVFGLYLVVLGCVLLLIPNLLLSIAGQPPATDPWVRMLGFLLLVLALYYLLAARTATRPFFQWTLYTRLGAPLLLVPLVLLHLLPGVALLFWLGDLAGALWTLWALRTDGAA